MEKVQEVQDTPEVFSNEIEMYFKQFIEQEEIKDMTTASHHIFYAALTYVYNNMFKGTKRLRLNAPIPGYINNNNINDSSYQLNKSNCNSYNYQYLNDILDEYIYLCDRYNKALTIAGFCRLTGIKQEYVCTWGSGENAKRLSGATFELYKRLKIEVGNGGEASLLSNKHPVATIAVMNRNDAMNASREMYNPAFKTAADLPQLGTLYKPQPPQLIDNSVVHDVQKEPESQ